MVRIEGLGRRGRRFGLDVTRTIVIAVTLGALPDALKNIDTYGEFLRGFDLGTGLLEDEPRAGLEIVLTLKLDVKADLEPSWTLDSDRAAHQQLERSLAWKDRNLLTPARIGTYANTNLSWARGSVLNRLTEERANLGSELAGAARAARATFGAQAGPQLAQTLQVVTETATALGVAIGASAQALLDAHSVSIGDGAISLHSETGIPLRSLGIGSGRLLVAGLQRAAAAAATVALADEVEYGLEPHRLMRLLDSLGAKDATQPLQVFMTTHSPVTLRELAGNQLFVVRQRLGIHTPHAPVLTTASKGPCVRPLKLSCLSPSSSAKAPARSDSLVVWTSGGCTWARHLSWPTEARMWTQAEEAPTNASHEERRSSS
ncbi:MAG: ATP-dependent endonuclease [Herminiimonas sp.]|nr:ATP-dependent endonuclease [Herminiimonas sp.]MDB5855492.1 ATP-dependent endonuclease [Herminiimonas sp.]